MTGKYEACRGNDIEKRLCNCAVYIRVNDNNPSYAFIDHCGGASTSINNRFRYFNNSLKNDLKKKDVLPYLDCENEIENENDLDEWKKIPLRFNFKCAKLKSSPCAENYMVVAL